VSKFDQILIGTAQLWASASYCQRSRVGCVITKDDRIIATGFNGTLPGEDNCCEENGITKDTVVHAEQNAITFCAKHGLSTKGCTLYTTVSPCMHCAKLIISSGITKVVFLDYYRDISGIELLKQFGITVKGINNES
jgi:dCMP deaminase